MSPTLGNAVSQVPGIDRRRFFGGVLALLAATSISGCAILSEPVGSNNSIEELEKKFGKTLIEYPGKTAVIPRGVKLVPNTDGSYDILSDMLSGITESRLRVNEKLILFPIKVVIKLIDVVKDNPFYVAILKTFGIEDGDQCVITQKSDGVLMVENLSRPKPVRMAKTEDE